MKRFESDHDSLLAVPPHIHYPRMRRISAHGMVSCCNGLKQFCVLCYAVLLMDYGTAKFWKKKLKKETPWEN
jgi:hypothetical protein